ncbi:MAG: hypothetical protein AB7E47_08995 [Desulfovibrionaceae bacterium]
MGCAKNNTNVLPPKKRSGMFNLLRGMFIGLLIGGMFLLVQHMLSAPKHPASPTPPTTYDASDAPRHDIDFAPGHPDARQDAAANATPAPGQNQTTAP